MPAHARPRSPAPRPAASPVPPVPQKYWADNTRAYRYVTAQTIRTTFLESEASEPQRLLLAAPPALAAPAPGGEEPDKALTTQK